MNAGGGCEAALTARWLTFSEYGELLCCMKFHLRLKGTVYKSYVVPAILYGCVA